MKGYAGQILLMDLSKETYEKAKTDEYEVDRFVGGFMMNCRLAYDVIPPQADALSPKNAIIFGAGPIIGSSAPMSSKMGWLSKNPMNGTITGGMAGGMFGPQMKWAGYDNIVITGKAKKPVYIKIMDEDVEICDATSIWGRDVYEVTDMLWKEYGGDSSVITTGKAGENLVFTSITLMDKVSTAGKGGLGAVFGSKNLKAIVVKGTKGIKVEDPDGLQKLTREFNRIITNDPRYPFVRDMGAYAGFDAWADLQGYSIRNWREKQDVPEVYQLYGPDIYKDRIKYRRVSDPFCPIACKDHVKLRVGPDEGLETFAASLYGRVNNWGARCQLGSYELVIKCQDFANRTGLCVHSITALIDWAVDLYKEGIITKEDTRGMELDWDFETTWALINQASEGKGFGRILGMGFLGAIDKIGRDCEKYAFQVKGIECLYDPRLNRLGTAEFGQVTNHGGLTLPLGRPLII